MGYRRAGGFATAATSQSKVADRAIEVVAGEATIFNKSETPPFEIEDDIDTGEDKRLQYRYLDLRRPVLKRAILARHATLQATRSHFVGEGFHEVETPFLLKYTPGGARNFLVPSRLSRALVSTLAETRSCSSSC